MNITAAIRSLLKWWSTRHYRNRTIPGTEAFRRKISVSKRHHRGTRALEKQLRAAVNADLKKAIRS